jgi:hypothetical protein
METICSKLESFLRRVDVHLGATSTPIAALQDIFIRTLVHLLDILGLFTKYLIDRGGQKSGFRVTFGRISRRASE